MKKKIIGQYKLYKSAVQSGFSLLEMMIALIIGLFLLFGLQTIFSSDLQTYIVQRGLAQLQNNQIMAMNYIGNTVQSAGYAPVYVPGTSTLTTTPLGAQTLAASTGSPLAAAFSPGQALFGGSLYGSDSIVIRSQAAMNCMGVISASIAVSTFTVNNGNLQCSINPDPNGLSPQTLVNGLQSMTLLYGVDPAGTGSATQYVTAANVAAWSNVKSVKVILNFVNPQNPSGPALPFIRVIGVMNQL